MDSLTPQKGRWQVDGLGYRSGKVAAGGAPELPVTANLKAHYKYNTGITGSSPVTAWADQSGNGYHLSNAGAPTESGGVITFDGSDDELKTGAAGSIGTVTQPYTFYALVRAISHTSGDNIADLGDGNVVIFQAASSGDISVYASETLGPASGLTVGSSFFAIAVVFNGTSSSIRIGSGGTPVTGNAGGTSASQIALAGYGDYSDSNFNGAFKEAIFYTAAHDSATQISVLEYLEEVNAL